MQTVVYLLRHAAYSNPKKIFHGRLPGFPLSREGKKQAERLASRLKGKSIVAVYSSPLTRARETAQIIAREFALPVTIDKRLMDIRTPLQGKPLRYIEAMKGGLYTSELIAQGGERLREIFDRMDSCMRDIVKKHRGHVVVVSHGDPIMSIQCRYRGIRLPHKFPYDETYVPQASGYEIRFQNGKPVSVSPFPRI
jgi:broad specificity phosphatase PhoE